MTFAHYHEYMGEFEIAGKNYFLEEITFTTDGTGKQIWKLVDRDTEDYEYLEYLPNQRKRMEHDYRMRQLQKDIQVWDEEKLLNELTRPKGE